MMWLDYNEPLSVHYWLISRHVTKIIKGELRRSRGYIAYKMERSASINRYMLERVLKIIKQGHEKVILTRPLKYKIFDSVYYNFN